MDDLISMLLPEQTLAMFQILLVESSYPNQLRGLISHASWISSTITLQEANPGGSFTIERVGGWGVWLGGCWTPPVYM